MRTWAFQTANGEAGVICGPIVVSSVNSADSQLEVLGQGPNLAGHTLLEVAAGGAGNGYRLADLMCVTNSSGWAGMIKVKTPAGTPLDYIRLHTDP